MCARAMLYKYRYADKKDFYKCPKEYIIKAFSACKKSMDEMTQNGGGINNNSIGICDVLLDDYYKKIKQLYIDINTCNEYLINDE